MTIAVKILKFSSDGVWIIYNDLKQKKSFEH
jgi:hypothetical protein